MAYLSRLSNRAFSGDFTAYSRSFACYGLCELVAAKSNRPFAVVHPNGRPSAVVPIIAPDRVRVACFYSMRRAFTPRLLAGGDVAELTANWPRYCRAFVVAEVNPAVFPSFRLLDCNATRIAEGELVTPIWTDLPTLAELDAALGSSLELVEEEVRHGIEEFGRSQRGVGAIGQRPDASPLGTEDSAPHSAVGLDRR